MVEEAQMPNNEGEEGNFGDELGEQMTVPKGRPRYPGVHRCGASSLATGFLQLASPALLCIALLCQLPLVVRGDDSDTSLYSASGKREDWLYSSSYLNIEYVGCVWGYVVGGAQEDYGCRENESEDGTYYWYQMANCRRAQVAYNVYASDSSSCSSSTFKESLMTKDGLAEFIYTMNTYDGNSPLAYVDYDDFPLCEEDGNGYYVSLGCTEDGQFSVDTFSDEYCLEYTGQDSNYDLSDLNSALQDMQSCYSAYDSSSGNSVYKTALAYLLPYSEPCSSLDSPLCTDNREMGGSSGRTHKKSSRARSTRASWANKTKYVLGSLLLVASVTMFMGILFTNRRRRRAMMHRKFRQSASRSRSSRSRSARKSRSSRSSSRKKRTDDTGDGGVFT